MPFCIKGLHLRIHLVFNTLFNQFTNTITAHLAANSEDVLYYLHLLLLVHLTYRSTASAGLSLKLCRNEVRSAA